MFPHWDFSLIPQEDETWSTEEYETDLACGERGYRGLLWLMKERPECNLLVTCHGGLLSNKLNNPMIVLVDGREDELNGVDGTTRTKGCTTEQFGNCETREFVMTAWTSVDEEEEEENVTDGWSGRIIRCAKGWTTFPG